MRTFYIDVYFLINFTADSLALYFSACFVKLHTTTPRIIISALIGASCAVVCYFLDRLPIAFLLAAIGGLSLTCAVVCKGTTLKRKARFCFAFVMFLALIGGAVYFVWDFLDRVFSSGIPMNDASINRKLILLSLIVLLSIGVFKMFVALFSSNGTERVVRIRIRFFDRTVSTEALVDSGNLAIDPMDMRPVLIIKKEVARCIFPENVVELSDPDAIDPVVRKRIRLIPVSRLGHTHLLTGIRADAVEVISEMGHDVVAVTVAIDKDEGDFGGYAALMPLSAIDGV